MQLQIEAAGKIFGRSSTFDTKSTENSSELETFFELQPLTTTPSYGMIYYYSLTWILKSELSFVASLWQEVKRGNLLTFLPFTTLVLDNVIILCIVIVFFGT